MAVGWALLVTGPAAAQPAPTAFEAADVHVSPPGATESSGFLPGGRVEFRAVTLLGLISTAYGIPADRVYGGPSWLDTDRFDVLAKAPGPASKPMLLAMLQNLLAERFSLSVQREDKPLPVYALVRGTRTPPKESTASGEPGCQKANEEDTITCTCRKTTLGALAENLPSIAPGYFIYPVVDRTGLQGAYDFKLRWVARGRLPAGPEGLRNSLSIFSSIEEQLGVKVELQTAPEPVLRVTRANRTPAPNPPGVMDILGPTPTEFEVVDVRPSGPGEDWDVHIDNGRIDAKAISLKDLIEYAYNLEDDELKGGAKWLESEKFDIHAKTAPTESDDTLRVMLQALLAERFGLKVHQERQPVTVYALTAVRPKLQPADPSGRSTCRMSRADGQRSYICRNVTMEQFASKLREAAAGYLDHPAVDLTGLKGSYAFTVTWAPQGRVFGRPAPPAAGGDSSTAGPAAASRDPSSELTVFEAVERQLGLKLAARKLPMPVVVIDRLERTPTEN